MSRWAKEAERVWREHLTAEIEGPDDVACLHCGKQADDCGGKCILPALAAFAARVWKEWMTVWGEAEIVDFDDDGEVPPSCFWVAHIPSRSEHPTTIADMQSLAAAIQQEADREPR